MTPSGKRSASEAFVVRWMLLGPVCGAVGALSGSVLALLLPVLSLIYSQAPPFRETWMAGLLPLIFILLVVPGGLIGGIAGTITGSAAHVTARLASGRWVPVLVCGWIADVVSVVAISAGLVAISSGEFSWALVSCMALLVIAIGLTLTLVGQRIARVIREASKAAS